MIKMKTDGGDGETLQERQENELKALQAIFMDDFEDLREKDPWKVARPPEVILTLTPQESMSGKKDVHVRVNLHVKCGHDYPKEIPELSLENPKGISNKNVDELRQELISLANELKGEVMIHELALHVEKYLHKHNKPQYGSFYEEMISIQRKKEEENAKEMQKQEEKKKQIEEQQRKTLQTEIQKKQEALKEEARQRKENKQQFTKSCSPDVVINTNLTSSSVSSQSTIRRERSQSIETIVPSRQQTPGSKRRRQSTLKSDSCLENEICQHSGVTNIVFKSKGERVIHRGKCLEHGNYGSVTFVGMDANSGDLVTVIEWVLKDKLHELNTNENVKQVHIIEQELMSLMRLQHYNLIHFLGITHSVEKDRIIVQVLREHVSGKSLSHHFIENRPLDIEKVRYYASQLVNVLHYLHQNCVVHKDLRDTCIYIENSDNIKLADYSIGKRLSDLSCAINKLDYHDPFPLSIGRGAKKADVFRLGLLLLFLIKGKIEKELPEIPSSLPNEVHDFLKKCLMKHEQDRWTIEQLCDHPFLKLPVKVSPSPQRADELIIAKEKEEEPDQENIPYLRSENCQSRLYKEFQILKWLGKGGFGDVLKAKNQLDGRIYAIKRIVLNQHNKQLNKKIMREVKLLSKLNHENIVRYYYSWIETVYVNSDSSNEETLSNSSEKLSLNEKSSRKSAVSLSDNEVEKLAPPRIDGSIEWSMSIERSSQIKTEEDSSSDEEEEEEDFFGTSFFPKSPDSSDIVVFEKGSNQPSDAGKDNTSQLDDKSASVNSIPVKSTTNMLQFMYIQMEFCEKSTLRNAIDTGLHSEEERMWRFFREIVEGLAHIHQQGIIHRDLKPVNIFLDSSDHVKIGDFGLATTDIITRRNLLEPTDAPLGESKINPEKDVSRSDQIDDGTLTGKVGTALYVAPELNISLKTYTQKVDIYSLGIIFLEMCYHPLNTAMERVKILTGIRSPEIIFPSDFDEEKMSRQAYIIRWLLNHDPNKRPTSIELLQSEYLPPPQMEEAELQEMLRHTINNPQSKLYKHMISTLLKQEMDEVAEYIYDMDIHKGSFNMKPILIHKHIRDALTKIFQKHGAINVITPLLVPKFHAFEQGDQCVSLMDHSGGVVTLPFELRVSFARYVVRKNITNLKRYCISRVYRERKVFGCHPRELFECAFDSVSSNPGSLIADAEVLTVVGDIIAEFQALQNRSYIFRVNHTLLVKAILIHSGVPDVQHNEVISIIGENNLESMDKFQIDNHLSILNLSDQTVSSLCSFLKMEGPINKITTHLKSITKQRQKASMLAKQAVAELETVINNATSLGLKDQIIVTPGLMYSTHQFSGFFFKVVCELKRKNRKCCIDTLAAGGRYDMLLNSMRISSSTNVGKEFHQSAVGVSIALEKIMSAVLEDEMFKPSSCYDVLVCSVGHQPMLKEKTSIIKELWASGIRSSLHYDSTQSLEEIQDACRDIGIQYIVILKETESGCRLRALEKDRFTEKKLNTIELPEYLQKCLACKFESGDSSLLPLMRLDSKSNFGGDSTSSNSFNNFSITFVTQEKLAANSKRRYESQISSHISSVLQFLSSKICVEILAVELDGQVLKNIASHIELESEDNFESSIKAIIERHPRYRKYLVRIFDELHELKFQKKCPVLMLYGLKDNNYKLLL